MKKILGEKRKNLIRFLFDFTKIFKSYKISDNNMSMSEKINHRQIKFTSEDNTYTFYTLSLNDFYDSEIKKYVIFGQDRASGKKRPFFIEELRGYMKSFYNERNLSNDTFIHMVITDFYVYYNKKTEYRIPVKMSIDLYDINHNLIKSDAEINFYLY